ncbi:DUF6236 family protein [Sphaerisporangium perillae]|uniref:DUF6236 family protein n=1 Tax=Sphaerisporangium perillae TaxID=2935860 RepID=UPI00200CF811|nr:DUF6236 family protein [Sphaerisporangium perillae]
MSEWCGLYYRHVHFRDEHWLKLTALYWDRLYRFHADNLEITVPRISYAEVGLIEAGFVRHVTPRPEEVRWAAERFLAALEGVDLSRYAVPPSEPFGPAQLGEGLAMWKTSGELIERLTGMDLAARSPVTAGRVRMHTTLAHAYLLVLGSQVAPGYGAAPLADDEFDHSATGLGARRLVAGVLDQPTPETQADEWAALLVNLSVAAVLPRNLDDIPVQRIVEFRSRYAGERARFRDAVDGMVAEATQLGGIRERDVLLDHLQSRFDTRIRPALDDLQRAMRGQRMETVWGAINVQAAMPPVMTSALALVATQPSAPQAAAIGLGGFAFGVWAAVLQRRRHHEQALRQSSMAYLHQLQTGLAPLGLAERVRAAAERFTPPRRSPIGP